MRKYDLHIEKKRVPENFGSIVELAKHLKIDKRTQEISLAVCWSNEDVFYSILGIGNARALTENTIQVAQFALLCNADRVAVLHNHPTEAAEASEGDINHLNKLKKMLDILDIELISDVILSYDGSYTDIIGGCDD